MTKTRTRRLGTRRKNRNTRVETLERALAIIAPIAAMWADNAAISTLVRGAIADAGVRTRVRAWIQRPMKFVLAVATNALTSTGDTPAAMPIAGHIGPRHNMTARELREFERRIHSTDGRTRVENPEWQLYYGAPQFRWMRDEAEFWPHFSFCDVMDATGEETIYVGPPLNPKRLGPMMKRAVSKARSRRRKRRK